VNGTPVRVPRSVKYWPCSVPVAVTLPWLSTRALSWVPRWSMTIRPLRDSPRLLRQLASQVPPIC
jgi:hypothetical protein